MGIQREHFELSDPIQSRAGQCCDLVIVMIALYTFIPPSKGLEIRTLEIVSEQQDFNPGHFKDKNAIVMTEDGTVLHFHNNKTRDFSGREELALQVGQISYRIPQNLFK